MRCTALLCLLGLLPAICQASADPSAAAAAHARVYYQDTVLVHAARTALHLRDLATSGTVVGPEELRRSGPSGIASALASVPGLNVFDLSGSESMGQVDARGFNSLGLTSHLLVLVDEVPVNDFDGDRANWNLLGASQVERVEVLRGPASYLWGNAAMAGVVNLVTRRGSRSGLRSVETSGGSYGAAAGSGSASWVTPRVQADVSALARHHDGFRAHSASDQGSAHLRVHAPLATRWQLDGRTLLHRGVQDIPGPLPDPLWRTAPRRAFAPGLPDPSPADWRREGTVNAALVLTGPLASGLSGTFTVGVDARDVRSRETIIPAGTLDHSARTLAARGETRLDWKTPWPLAPEVLFGAEGDLGGLASRYFDPTASFAGSPAGAADVRRTTGAFSLLARLEPAPRWTVSAGARLDWLRSRLQDAPSGAPENDDLSAFSPAGSITCDLDGASALYATVGGSFKTPTLEQLYDPRPYGFDPDGPGPAPPMILHISTHALAPQRGTHGEVGFRTRLGARVSADACVYHSRSRDEIGFDLAHFRYDNIARSIHSGFEALLAADLADRAQARLSYTWTRATFDGGDHDGRQINAVPVHRLCGTLVLGPWRGATASTEVRYVQTQWLDEMNTYAIPAWAVADAGVNQVVGELEIFASVRNGFDRRYAGTGYLTMSPLGEPLPLYYPGAGRTALVGIRFPAPRPAAGSPSE